MKISLRAMSASLFSSLGMLLCVSAFAQNFTLDTSVTPPADDLYSYSFTVNYVQDVTPGTLTDAMYDWYFSIDPSLSAPTQVVLPTGWKSTYDATSGQFDFYTEGPNGFGSGDFGNNVIQPGHSLSGFGLTTPAAPDLSIAFATDEQFNQDAVTATLPTTTPAAVPEPSTITTFSIGALSLLLFAVRRRSKRTGRSI